MNVKVLVISNQNVPHSSRIKKGMSVSWLDDDSEGELMMKQPNISQLLLVGVNLMKIPMMMYPMENLPIHTKSYMPKVRSVGTKCV